MNRSDRLGARPPIHREAPRACTHPTSTAHRCGGRASGSFLRGQQSGTTGGTSPRIPLRNVRSRRGSRRLRTGLKILCPVRDVRVRVPPRLLIRNGLFSRGNRPFLATSRVSSVELGPLAQDRHSSARSRVRGQTRPFADTNGHTTDISGQESGTILGTFSKTTAPRAAPCCSWPTCGVVSRPPPVDEEL